MSFFSTNNSLAINTAAKPGGLFSQATTTSTPFGAPAFGANPVSGFGTPATAAAVPTLGGFGGFGANNQTNSNNALPTLTGFGGFGNAATSTAPALFSGTGLSGSTTTNAGFGFGQSSGVAAAPGFGFGTSATSSLGFTGFGVSTSTTSTAPTFGGFGVGTATGTSGFGGFGSNFGKSVTSTVTPGFGGFGGTTNFMLGQPQQQLQQASPEEAFAQSIFHVSIFGDERDAVIAKWNYLQAMWGTGKSFYSQSSPPVEITPENYFCRLKAISYCRQPGRDNRMGLVSLVFNKPIADLKVQKYQILTSLNAILGNRSNLIVNVDSEKAHDIKKSQLVIYVEEKSQFTPAETKRILATELCAYLNQMNVRSQLTNLGVCEIVALVLPDEDQLKAYLENPPKGIDPRMWRQATTDNPDPCQFLPVPIIGFGDLKERIKWQEKESENQALFLRNLEKNLLELRRKHIAASSKIAEHKRSLADLSHRILKVIVKQESSRKIGITLTPEEEALRTKLENMQAFVSAPNKFKGRISELLSQIRTQRNQYTPADGNEYVMDKDCEDEIKQFLGMQQKAIEVVIETITTDMQTLQIIREGMPKLMQSGE